MSVHPTAIVASGAQLHPSVEVGPYAIIEGRTTIGERNRIFHHASVGAPPQDLKYGGEPTELVIGDENSIREFTTLHTGTVGGGGVTRIGNKNLFMAYTHVAHDCVIGDGNILPNAATLAGHVEVGNFVHLGALSAVHQFSRIGDHAFIAGGSIVVMDVPPYCMVQGDRAELAGINQVGLKRHGYTDEQQARVKEAYRVLFRSKMGLNEALSQLREGLGEHPEIALLLDFITTSKRGITR